MRAPRRGPPATRDSYRTLTVSVVRPSSSVSTGVLSVSPRVVVEGLGGHEPLRRPDLPEGSLHAHDLDLLAAEDVGGAPDGQVDCRRWSWGSRGEHAAQDGLAVRGGREGAGGHGRPSSLLVTLRVDRAGRQSRASFRVLQVAIPVARSSHPRSGGSPPRTPPKAFSRSASSRHGRHCVSRRGG